MKNDQIHFRVILRSPKYPVIVIADDAIWQAFNIKELAATCYLSDPVENSTSIQVIDSSGEVFLYMPEQIALIPGIGRKKWTKKRIVERFNDSEAAKKRDMHYSSKSLSNKRLAEIVNDICNMLSNNARL